VKAPDTVRLLLTVQYDGAAFHGWQLQPDHRTVQGTLESALSRLADAPRSVLGSGRTDTGVHATGQVASVDMPAKWSAQELHRALNATLPDDLWVEAVRLVASEFHPRFDAVARTYVYDVGTAATSASPFDRRWCWPLCEELDQELLGEAARCLPGRHSFAAFAKAGQPERGEECAVATAQWLEWRLGYRFSITADRYLHHMVRYLVGTMVDIARARRPLADLPGLLEKDPALVTSPPAPPQGLFLSQVEYPEHALLGQRPKPPSSRSNTDRAATV
jgi:tRNA pseudouridine38-40 synthase